MSDPAEFLLARIGEDETVARQGGQWDGGMEIAWRDVGGISDSLIIGTDRVLAECQAKRRIVEQYVNYLSAVRAYRSPRWADAMNEQDKQDARQAEARHRVAEDVARLLALPYADHPDYDETWRP